MNDDTAMADLPSLLAALARLTSHESTTPLAQPTRSHRPRELASAEKEVLYGRDQSALRVFVSSRMNKTLDVERNVAREVIRSFPHRRSWLWEYDAPAGVLHSEDECVELARGSDELILIVGDELSPVTRAEYDAASSAGIECYVMIKALPSKNKKIDDFVDAARRHSVTRTFANPAELRSLLELSMRSSAVRASRRQNLDRRGSIRNEGAR